MTTKLKITQFRSRIGAQRKHKETLDALGIRRNNSTVYRNDTPAVRGMVNTIRHLVRWEEIDEKDIPEKEASTSGVTVTSKGGGAAGANEDSVKE